jgi:hypothetical protein
MHLPDTTIELVAPNGELRSTHALPLVDGAEIDHLLDRLREASGMLIHMICWHKFL